MYSKLREGEIDALSIESSIDFLIDVEKDSPIVLALHPYTHCEINAAVWQFWERNERCGIEQDTCVLCQDQLNHLRYLCVITAILHAESPIYTSGSLLAEVGHNTAAQRAIWDKDVFVIHGSQDSVKHLDALYRASDTLSFDVIAYLIRFEKQDD